MISTTPVAIACSDLHLTLKQPACRKDKDWKGTQQLYLNQLQNYSQSFGRKLPIICAGDIFDRWNPSPELINFALRYLPDGMYCVPGQHDLPNHNMSDMHRSGYGVLRASGKINHVVGTITLQKQNFQLSGFGWGEILTPPEESDWIAVAFAHRYVWKEGFSYPGAPSANHVTKLRKILKGYSIAIFGDNHKGFLTTTGETTVFNCGGFIRRKSDEIHYRPQIGTIYSDGTIKPTFLDTELDQFHDNPDKKEAEEFDMKEFLETLEGLGEHDQNFHSAIKEFLDTNQVSSRVRDLVWKAFKG